MLSKGLTMLSDDPTMLSEGHIMIHALRCPCRALSAVVLTMPSEGPLSCSQMSLPCSQCSGR